MGAALYDFFTRYQKEESSQMGSKQKEGAVYNHILTIFKKYKAKNNNLANVRYGSKSRVQVYNRSDLAE